MRKTTLLTTATAAAIALCAPGALGPAGAGNNKVPTVKVRPMVRPHIRPITPRVHVRIPTSRLVNKKHRHSKRKDRDTARAAKVPSQRVVVAKPAIRFDVPLPSPRPDLTGVTHAPALGKKQASELARIKDVKQAIEASEGVSELARADHALGLPDPLHPEHDRDAGMSGQDNPVPIGPGLIAPGSRQFGDALAGAGVDSPLFGFLDNSHGTAPRNTPGSATGDAAKQALGVTPGSIAAAIGGVAGHGTTTYRDPGTGTITTKTVTPDSIDVTKTTVTFNETGTDSSVREDRVNYDPNTRNLVEREVMMQAGVGAPQNVHRYNYISGREDTWVRGWHGRRVPGSYSELHAPSGQIRSVDRRYDPDHVEGGDHPFHWLKEKPKTILDRITGIGPGAMPQDPGSSDPVQSTSRPAVVSQQDLVSQYDPDSARGGGTPTPLGGICTHSEC